MSGLRPLFTSKRKISLATLLTGLVSFSVVLTFTILLTLSYHSNKKSLTDTTLALNYSSAVNMSKTMDSLFKSIRSSLRFSASQLSKKRNQAAEVNDNLDMLRNGSNYFNSISVVDETGVVRHVSPRSIGTVGKQIVTQEAKYALASKKPYLSSPYITRNSKRLILFMSEPIFDEDGTYRGFIGGTIYLQEINVLNMIFGNDPANTRGSSFYIVGSNGQLLFHPDKSRLGEDISANQVVQKLIKGQSGHEQMVNLRGEALLAGYVKVPENGWGVVVVSPISVVYEQLNGHIQTILLYTLPTTALLMFLVIWLARRVARPLVDLASLMSKISTDNVELPEEKIHWNREADLLTGAFRYAITEMKKHADQLTLDAMTDPLTGLANRRTLEDTMQKWSSQNIPYSIILMDIDRFKAINDTYGHPVGDEVLKHFGNVLAASSRPGDVCGRYGGEEFMALLARASVDEALSLAEHIRIHIEQKENPINRPVTVSLGIAHHPFHSDSIEEVVQMADQALYLAKKGGRNQTVIADRA